jgi:hypothetical protein
LTAPPSIDGRFDQGSYTEAVWPSWLWLRVDFRSVYVPVFALGLNTERCMHRSSRHVNGTGVRSGCVSYIRRWWPPPATGVVGIGAVAAPIRPVPETAPAVAIVSTHRRRHRHRHRVPRSAVGGRTGLQFVTLASDTPSMGVPWRTITRNHL